MKVVFIAKINGNEIQQACQCEFVYPVYPTCIETTQAFAREPDRDAAL
jgi:hypothetical protein